ncbi:hypothetical protein [Peribacillus asahii]|uniref:hypothetical protein n=1 Tax=Peribacillus asahii TaxID=228899 RepID=UPI0035A619AA
MFVTEEMLAKIIPKNRYLSILVTCLIGALLPLIYQGMVCQWGSELRLRTLVNM